MQSLETRGQLKTAAARRPRQAAHWRAQFADGWEKVAPLADLHGASWFVGGLCVLPLDAAVSAKLDGVTRRNDAALEVYLIATVAAVIGRLAAAHEVVVGHPCEEGFGKASPFGCALPIKLGVNSEVRFKDLLANARDRYLAGLAHQDYPIELIAEEFGVEIGNGANPFFDVAVEVARSESSLATRAQLVILVRLIRTAEGLQLELRFDDRRYLPSTAAYIARTIVQALAQFVSVPEIPLGHLDLMGPDDHAVLAMANNTTVPYRNTLRIDQIFAFQRKATPNAIAVRLDDQTITYAELDQRSNRLAHSLRDHSVGSEQLVAVLAERSVEMLVGILAIIKAGGAYLPLDSAQPWRRLEHMLNDSGARVILTQAKYVRDLAGLVHAGKRMVVDLADDSFYSTHDNTPEARGSARDLAYAIYTSGSTGTPKAALIEHHSVINRIDWMQKAYPLSANDVILQKTTIAFDVSVWELFWWSFAGASVCLLPPDAEKDPEEIIRAVERHGVSTIHFVPSMLSAFLDYVEATGSGPRLRSLRRVFASGEALGVHHVEQFTRCLAKPHGVELINLYGPTEATIDVSHYVCTGRGPLTRVPIGRPIDNIRLYIVDEAMRVQPKGVPGELCIAGVGLARGYHNRPELTKERFVEHPFEGESRVYRTGDLARWLPQGELEYLGRMDHQVKLRGYRIELAEIEHCLRLYPGVRDAVVLAHGGTAGERVVLHGYVQADAPIPAEELQKYLSKDLPDYMIPAQLVTLERFPISPNGKLDRKALPEPVAPRATAAPYVAPRTTEERALVQIWQEVLQIDRIGIHDNFFVLGGTSIHFVTVLAKARTRGLSFTFQQLFANPTIAQLAQSLTVADIASGAPRDAQLFALLSSEDRMAVPDGVEDAYPMSMLQAGLIFQNELTFGTAQYHDILTYVIKSPFYEQAFVEAVSQLVRHHAIFRTSYHLTGFSEYVQQVHREAELPLEIVDLRQLDEIAQERWLSDWLERERAHCFDWERGGLVRFHVHVLRDDLYRYTLSQHNSALDGWSITLVHLQLFQAYYRIIRNEPTEKRPGINYLREYIVLEKRSLATGSDRAFWTNVLEGGVFTKLPRWEPERELDSLKVFFHEVEITKRLSDGLIALADRLAVPLKTVLMAAHLKFLSLVSGQPEVIAGYEHSGRPEVDGATEAVALFLNTIPFRVNVSAARSWEELIAFVYRTEISVLPHRRYPMAQMKHDLGTQSPLFETAFNYTHFYRLKELKSLPEFSLLDVRASSETEFVLRAEFSRHFFTDDVKLSLHWHAHVFTDRQMQVFAGYYQRIFELMVEKPSAPLAHPSLRGAEERGLKHARDHGPLPHFGAARWDWRTIPALDASMPRPRPESDSEKRIAAVWSKALDIPLDEIYADDNFFDLGGNSLAAMRAIILLKRQVSLADFMRNSTLNSLAQKLEEKASGSIGELLHELSRYGTRHESGDTLVLVCFPYAGGNAINFQPLADELQRASKTIRVIAVELPGHDSVALGVGLADLRHVAQRISEELLHRFPTSRFVFWGHCIGSVVAIQTARHLQASGHPIERLFVGGKLIPELAEVELSIAEVSRLTDKQVMEVLARETGYIEFQSVAPEMATALARVFRHDSLNANRYLADALRDRPDVSLTAPIMVVVAADDVLTAGYAQHFGRWSIFSKVAGLRELPDGGHYFCRTRPAEVARIISRELQGEAYGA